MNVKQRLEPFVEEILLDTVYQILTKSIPNNSIEYSIHFGAS